MIDDHDEALRAVLDPDADQNVPPQLRHAAELDLEAIRRGLALLAEGARQPGQESAPASSAGTWPLPARDANPRPRRSTRSIPRPRRPLTLFVAASLTLGAAVAVTQLVRPPTGQPSGIAAQAPTGGQRPVAPPPPPPGTTGDVPAATGEPLSTRVRNSQRIVVGTVARLQPATSVDGSGYLRVVIRVGEAIKGPAGTVVVLDRPDGQHPAWRIDDRVLAFLTSAADVPPPHLTIEGRGTGLYLLDGGRPVQAGFTLDDVRRAAAGAR